MSTYKCAKCKKTFKPVQGGLTMRCLVNHSKNDCCHYGEREIVYESPEKHNEKIHAHKRHVLENVKNPECLMCLSPEIYESQDLHVCSCGDVHVHG